MRLNPCGYSCTGCPSYLKEDENGKFCSGCTDIEGNPWWGTCGLFRCTRSKQIPHCGVCNEFPCDLQISHFDPDNPQGQRNAIIRTGLLTIWAKYGMDKALEIEKKLRSNI